MSTFRFTLMAVGLFAMAFIGISWANKGFPVMAMRAEPMKPDARIATFDDSAKKGIRKDWEDSKTSQSDGNKERDKLRIELLQASIGWIYDNDHNAVALDNQQRIDALIDLINAAERKVIVFSPFKSATAGVAEALRKEKIEFASVTGDTSSSERNEIFSAFQGTAKYKVLNAHPECMSHGLTLTAADTIIWFGPITKLETYEQANARITRVGQAHKQQVIRMIGTPAERLLYRRLAAKEDLQNNVLDLIAELTKGD